MLLRSSSSPRATSQKRIWRRRRTVCAGPRLDSRRARRSRGLCALRPGDQLARSSFYRSRRPKRGSRSRRRCRRLGELDDARAQLAIARETFERMGASGPSAQVDGELSG